MFLSLHVSDCIWRCLRGDGKVLVYPEVRPSNQTGGGGGGGRAVYCLSQSHGVSPVLPVMRAGAEKDSMIM